MIPSEPKRIDMPFAYEGAKNDIPTTGGEETGNASMSLGFPPITQQPLSQGGIPPQRRDFNGILYILSAYAFYAQSGGLYSWDSTLDYAVNCIITHNNNIYICIANNGASTSAGAVEPGTNASYWLTLYEYLMASGAGDAGSATNPIYVKDGKFTASDATIGSGTKPVYLNNGVITASSSSVGGTAQPVRLNAGNIETLTATVGSGTKPVYMSSGTVTASSSTVGSGTNPVYMSSGTVTASGSTVGGTARGVYLNSGTVTALSSTVGSGTQPVYMSSGTVTASTSTVGADDTPVYLKSGVLTACSSSGGVTDSSTSKGYIIFGDIKIMWGVEKINSTTTISLPSSFSNTDYSIQLTQQNWRDANYGSDDTNFLVIVQTKRTGSFTAVCYDTDGERYESCTASWLAIGY